MRPSSIALTTCLMIFVGAAFAGPVDETRPAKPKGVIDIENVSGSVDVIGWDRPEVHVEGTLGARVKRLDFENRNGHTLIRVVLPNVRFGGSGMWARLTIHVPWTSRLDIDVVSADVTVSGVHGAMELEAVSGAIKVSPAIPEPPKEPEANGQEGNEPDEEPIIPPVPSEVDAHTVSGSIDLTIDADEIQAETVSGRISIEGNAGEIDAQTVSGRITVEGVAEKIEAETVSGDIAATGWWKGYRSESISGDVELRMRPEKALLSARGGTTRIAAHSGDIRFRGCVMPNGRLDASAHSGDIELMFLGSLDAKLDVGTHSGLIMPRGSFLDVEGLSILDAGKTLRCAIGTGDGEIRIQTFSGDILLDKP